MILDVYHKLCALTGSKQMINIFKNHYQTPTLLKMLHLIKQVDCFFLVYNNLPLKLMI